MITVEKWEELKEKQAELDRLIVQKSPTDLNWISRFNAERLKLALLVEVGEFANEIKSFKAWRKKPEINWDKVREELIDCLGYFLGLVSIYKIDFSPIVFNIEYEGKELSFNELLLEFFARTNDLYIAEKEEVYKLEKAKINEKGQKSYHDWWKKFGYICWKLKLNEKELTEVYLTKNKINQQRAKAV